MGSKRKSAPFVVVDVETTGLYNSDRIVEVAAVTLDENWDICGEFDTLVNPERDVGPTDIHGITPSMVSAAPTFLEISTALATHLDGAILVAHNLAAFDARMLRNEYARIGATFDAGRGICTLSRTGERLGVACERFRIPLNNAHRALDDARATAALLPLVLEDEPEVSLATFRNLSTSAWSRTLRREAASDKPQATRTPLRRIIDAARYPTTSANIMAYLDLLDWVLDDLVLTDEETRKLRSFVQELGISGEQQQTAHRHYLGSLIAAARRDKIVTEDERTLLVTAASLLGVEASCIPSATELPQAPAEIAPGTCVCFTGTAVDANGCEIEREYLEACAAQMDLQPVPRVTKKRCKLLVAADVNSSSGKVKSARKWEIPIMSVADFLSRASG